MNEIVCSKHGIRSPAGNLMSHSAEFDFNMMTRYFPEFQTNRWAIKAADLFQALFKHGIGRGAKQTVSSKSGQKSPASI